MLRGRTEAASDHASERMTDALAQFYPRIVAAGRTDTGRQRRHNEDHVLVKLDLHLFVVADGMGGHNAGDVASRLTTTSVSNFFEATENGRIPGEPPEDEANL